MSKETKSRTPQQEEWYYRLNERLAILQADPQRPTKAQVELASAEATAAVQTVFNVQPKTKT